MTRTTLDERLEVRRLVAMDHTGIASRYARAYLDWNNIDQLEDLDEDDAHTILDTILSGRALWTLHTFATGICRVCDQEIHLREPVRVTDHPILIQHEKDGDTCLGSGGLGYRLSQLSIHCIVCGQIARVYDGIAQRHKSDGKLCRGSGRVVTIIPPDGTDEDWDRDHPREPSIPAPRQKQEF